MPIYFMIVNSLTGVIQGGNRMQKILPCLWFNHQAEEAVDLYTSLFADSRILSISRYG